MPSTAFNQDNVNQFAAGCVAHQAELFAAYRQFVSSFQAAAVLGDEQASLLAMSPSLDNPNMGPRQMMLVSNMTISGGKNTFGTVKVAYRIYEHSEQVFIIAFHQPVALKIVGGKLPNSLARLNIYQRDDVKHDIYKQHKLAFIRPEIELVKIYHQYLGCHPWFSANEAECLLYYTMPLMRGVSLYDYAGDRFCEAVDICTLRDRLFLLRAIVREMRLFQIRTRCAHNDLNLNNIFVYQNPTTGEYTVRLIDYDMCKPFGQQGNLKDGTRIYYAPERMAVGQPAFKHSAENDVYSFGVFMAWLLADVDLHSCAVHYDIYFNGADNIDLDDAIAQFSRLADPNVYSDRYGLSLGSGEQAITLAKALAELVSRSVAEAISKPRLPVQIPPTDETRRLTIDEVIDRMDKLLISLPRLGRAEGPFVDKSAPVCQSKPSHAPLTISRQA